MTRWMGVLGLEIDKMRLDASNGGPSAVSVKGERAKGTDNRDERI